MEERKLTIDGESIKVTIERSARRRRRLSLTLDREGNALLRVPVATPNTEIEAMLLRHREWLRDKRAQLQRYRQQHPPLAFVDGERIGFRGGDLILAIHQRPGPTRISLQSGQLLIESASRDVKTLDAALQHWFRRQALAHFPQRLQYWSQCIGWVAQTPALRIRKMRSRWGSCSADGRICLNSELVKLPEVLLDYVIIHELCHLREFNHSPRFYAAMASVMPDWRRHRDALRNVDLRAAPGP